MPIRFLLLLASPLLFVGCASTSSTTESTTVAQYVPCDNDEVVTGSRLPTRRDCVRSTENKAAPTVK
jgi:uncharacterized lipoprotein YajG